MGPSSPSSLDEGSASSPDAGDARRELSAHPDLAGEFPSVQHWPVQLNDAIPQLLWTCTRDGDCDYVNRHWTELTGLPLEAARGIGWEQAIHPEDRARYRAEFRRAAALGSAFEHEFQYRSAAGNYRWMVARGSPVRDEAGCIVRWIGTCMDIDESRRAQEALRESEERVRIATEAGRIGTWDWDIEADRVVWSRQLFAMHGLSAQDFAGRACDCESIVHPADLERLRETVARTLQGGTDYTIEFRARGPEGSYRWFWTRAAVIRDARGRPLRLIGATSDVTERKRDEESLREADRKKDTFLAMLAHELRSPLAPICNGIHLLRSLCPSDQRIDRVVAMLGRQVTHLARLVDDLLDVSRITQGKITLRRGPLSLGELVREVVCDRQPDFDRHEVSLSCSVPGQEVWVDGDRTRLVQALGNLLHNAMKFSLPTGHAQVRLAAVDGWAELAVADDGVGIDPAVAPLIFEPFAQAAQTAERAQGGLGLGLALVKGLVALHGGSVGVTSSGLGRGATFTVRLPLQPPNPGQTPGCRAPTSTTVRRVLIVEDNPDAAESLEMIVSSWGHEVRVAPTGCHALELMSRWEPEVVLCDIGLPGMDGYQVGREILRRGGARGVYLVALTGYGQEADVREASRAGFKVHLTKPVDFERLASIIADRPEAPG
jgi:PAS domain S-box-containing protein